MSGPRVIPEKTTYSPTETVKFAVDPGTDHPFTASGVISGTVTYADGASAGLSGTVTVAGQVSVSMPGYNVSADPANPDGLHFVATPA